MEQPDQDRIQQEATAWFSRLQSRTVSTEELTEFARWRREPGHAEAYARVDAMWDATSKFSGDPDVQDAVKRAAKRPRTVATLLTSLRRAWMLVPLGAVAVIAAVLLWPNADPAYQTGVGEALALRLNDGTKIQLDTNTRVAVAYRKDQRGLHLTSGQAYFDVHHDPSRPFVVSVDGITVTALGTRFDVRTDADVTRVTLLEGRVAVARADGSGDSTILAPGESVTVRDSKIAPVARHAAADLTWRMNELTFNDTRLIDAVAEVNRYTPKKLALSDARLADRPISGVFSTTDATGFVAAVNTIFGHEAVTRTNAARPE